MQGLVELLAIVTVGEGILKGELLENAYGRSFYSFKGVPYAQPPVGDLRFKAPQPVTPWEGVRNATKYGSPCFQMNLQTGSTGSEDCLYLNIYTANLKPEKPLPVMFWIHGGGFISGNGNDEFFGPEFLMREDVILVTINYRLEALGFLSLETADVPGNAAMKDQVAALKWVKTNIAKFGGDPDNITIFGQSAGGGSVSYHLISPMTKGLFKRAIAQSGAAKNVWARAFQPRQRALALARQLGFFSEDDKLLYEFFKNQTAESFVSTNVPILLSEKGKVGSDLSFSVTEEKDFGQERYFTGDFNSVHEDVEIMVGYVSDEGVVGLGSLEDYNKKLILGRDFPEFFVSKPLAVILPVDQQLNIGRRIKQFYFNNSVELTGNWRGMVDYYSMDMFQYEIVQYAKLYAKKQRTAYLYRFSCKTERNIMALLYGAFPIIGHTSVAAHSDELMYLFNFKLLPLTVDVNSETFRLMEKVIKLWTNFATYGNPTPDDSLGAIWKPYTLESQDYLEIANEFFASTAPDNDQIQLWESINNITHIV